METSPPLLWLHSGLNVPLTPVKRPGCNKESVITRTPLAVFVLTIIWFSCHYQQETRATFTWFTRWRSQHLFRRNHIKLFKQTFACKAISSILWFAKMSLLGKTTTFLCSICHSLGAFFGLYVVLFYVFCIYSIQNPTNSRLLRALQRGSQEAIKYKYLTQKTKCIMHVHRTHRRRLIRKHYWCKDWVESREQIYWRWSCYCKVLFTLQSLWLCIILYIITINMAIVLCGGTGTGLYQFSYSPLRS